MAAFGHALARTLACLTMLAVAGCGGTPQPLGSDGMASGERADSPAGQRADGPIPPPSPATTGEPAAAVASLSPAVAPPRPASPPPAPSLPFGQLTGMSAGGVTDLLGPPQFRRDEATAQVWQYRGTACVLDLFLYRIGAAMRVRHAEARPRAAPTDATASPAFSGTAADDCLGQLAAARPAR